MTRWPNGNRCSTHDEFDKCLIELVGVAHVYAFLTTGKEACQWSVGTARVGGERVAADDRADLYCSLHRRRHYLHRMRNSFKYASWQGWEKILCVVRSVCRAVMAFDPASKGRACWTQRWKGALNVFDITFDGRLSTYRAPRITNPVTPKTRRRGWKAPHRGWKTPPLGIV